MALVMLVVMALSVPLRARPAGTQAPTPVQPQVTRSGGSLVAQQVPPADPTATPTPAPEATPTEPQPELRETRALWVSRWDFKDVRDVQRVVDRAAEAHFNVILFQVRGQADAMYPSELEPWAADLTGTFGKDPGYDPLADLIESAHARGIEVHAWMNTYPVWMGQTPPPASASPTPMYHDFGSRYGKEWLEWKGSQPMQLGKGDYLWANPAHPAVQDRIVAVARDLLARYELDGLHLDYIRYGDPELSLDPVSNKAYAGAAAREPGLTREQWQRDQVTGLVQRIADEALPERPGARLTTTAWPVYKDRWGWYKGKDGYGAMYQDSQSWARDGRVSAIMPMLYGMTLDGHLDRYEVLANDYVTGSQPGGVVAGITAGTDDFADIAARIEITRKLGARGQALFSYGALEEHNYWQALRDGPYAQPAVPNWG